MTTSQPSRGLDSVGFLAILTAAAVICYQQRVLGREGSDRTLLAWPGLHRPAPVPPTPRAGADPASGPEAEKGPPPAASSPSARSQMKALQLRVEAARSRDSVQQAYGPLIKKLGLDEAKATQLESLLAQEQLAARDALAAAKAQGIQSLAGFKAAVAEAEGPYDQQISSLLDPDGFAQLDAYRDTLPEQETVAKLTEHLSASPTPLNESQQAQLVQLIDQLEPSVYRQNESLLSAVGMAQAPLTNAMIGAAPGILSPPQVEALQSQQAAWLAHTQLELSLRNRAP